MGAAAASIAAPIVGGLIGQDRSSGDRAAAMGANRDALAAMQGVSLPDVEKQKILLQKYALQGTLSPEEMQTLSLGPSAMENISLPPELKADQMAGLQSLKEQVDAGGLTPEQQAQYAKLQRGVAAQQQAEQAGILQQLAARGVAGSGQELAARLAASQAAANREQEQAQDLAAQAFNQKQAALQNMANLAGNISTQQFGQQSSIASAKDLINKFNTTNAQNVLAANVQNRNQAQAANLNAAQNVSNANVDTSNKQEQYNKGLLQQNFENQMKRATGVAGAESRLAGALNDNANATSNMWSSIGSGAGSGVMGAKKAGLFNFAPSEGSSDASVGSAGTRFGNYATNGEP